MTTKILTVIFTLIMLTACGDYISIDIATDCGTTYSKTDTIRYAQDTYPNYPDVETYGEMVEIALRLYGGSFCPKDGIKASYSLELKPDTAEIFVNCQIHSDTDTLFFPINYRQEGQNDYYSGTLDAIFPKSNPGEGFAILLILTYRSETGVYPNLDYLNKILMAAGIEATYQKKETD
jgi:hypothetical protein